MRALRDVWLGARDGAQRGVYSCDHFVEPSYLLGNISEHHLIELVGSERPALGDSDTVAAFTAELQAAVDGVAAGGAPDLLSGQLARDALVLCHRECESVKAGGKAVAV